MKLKNKEIIYLLEQAKNIYINNNYCTGMCSAISDAYLEIYNDNLDYDNIIHIIPKFNTKFLNVTINSYGYWWLLKDNKSRIEAFDKLIKYYKHNTIYYRIKFYFESCYYKCIKIIKQL